MYDLDVCCCPDLTAATPPDISCETPHPLPGSPRPALGLSYDIVPACRPQFGTIPLMELDQEIGNRQMQDVATHQVGLLPTRIDPTPINDARLSIIRVIVSCPSQVSQSLDLKIGPWETCQHPHLRFVLASALGTP